MLDKEIFITLKELETLYKEPKDNPLEIVFKD